MPLDDANSEWQFAIDLPRLSEKQRAVVRIGSKQIALFTVGERVYACNNRCPHEGYPLVEAIGHMAWDVLREPCFPYVTEVAASPPTEVAAFPAHEVAVYSDERLLEAIEQQDEAAAIAQIRGALDTGLHFAQLERTLTAAALAHYAAFGHALDAAAIQLLRFDERYEHVAGDNVAHNVGWLDVTHGVTFGSAVRIQCSRFPELWPQGLLQMSLFIGRNSGFLADDDDAAWQVEDEQGFDAECRSRVLDHGLGLPIDAVHLLKTWRAVREEIAAGAPPAVAAHLRAALKRFLHAPLKDHHSLRAARQALRFVALED